MKFLVLSTGSSGSTSLAATIKACGIKCRHERDFEKPLLWAYTKSEAMKRLRRFKANENYGEVAISHLPYLATFLAEIPELKVIGLKRDKDKTVQTIVNESIYTNPFSLNINHLYEIAPNDWSLGYPKFTQEDEKTIRECASIFYDSYYYRLEEYQKLFPNKIRIFSTEEINSDAGLRQIYDFLGVPMEKRNYKKFRLNVHDPGKYGDWKNAE